MRRGRLLLLVVGLGLAGGCAMLGGGAKPAAVTLRVYEEVDPGYPSTMAMDVVLPASGQKLRINRLPALTEKDIMGAQPLATAGGTAIVIQWDVRGAMRLDELSTRMRSRHIVVLLNNRPLVAVPVIERLARGILVIHPDYTDQEAQALIDSLNALGKENAKM